MHGVCVYLLFGFLFQVDWERQRGLFTGLGNILDIYGASLKVFGSGRGVVKAQENLES